MTTERWEFLKESETSLGQFYPLHYIVAGYASMDAARDAQAAFQAAGKGEDDVRVVDATFVAKRLESREDEGLLDRVKARVVRVVGTEMGFLNDDRKHARAGGAFLFAYAPDEASATAAKQIFELQPPVYARRYLRPAIEIIIDRPQST